MPDDASPPTMTAARAPLAFGGRRLIWPDLPADLREEIEAVACGRVVSATSVSSGFSPGFASILTLAGGQRIFVKAARATDEPTAARLHRAEAEIATRLPSEVPSAPFLWGHGDEDWIVLAYTAIDGRSPRTPWERAELDRVLGALQTLSEVGGAREISLPPAGPDLGGSFTGWARLLDDPDPDLPRLSPWAHDRLEALAQLERNVLVACEGEAIVHGDVRADNLLLSADRVYLVDWPYAMRGAAWLDLAMFLPSVGMQGIHGVFGPVLSVGSAVVWEDADVAGPWLAALFDGHPLGSGVHPGDLRSIVGGLAGFFLDAARQPPPPSIPNLRAFQRAQGVAALAWLRHLGI